VRPDSRRQFSGGGGLGLAYSAGIELYGEKKFARSDSAAFSFSVFGSGSLIYARYGKDIEETAVSGNWVELVPPVTLRSGIRVTYKKLRCSVLGNYVHKHFSDGTNAVTDPTAVSGVIPSYYVLDFSASYELNKWLKFSGGVNNFTNNKYFTRRASSYPGPGIIASDGVGFYLGVEIKF
jgi:Fe(3+) dicitrate transport protein